jgi:hypothetical protein
MTISLLSPFENLPYFTIEGFRQIAGEQLSDAHVRTKLNRWVKTGRLIALKKGVYMHTRFFERRRQEAAFGFEPAIVRFAGVLSKDIRLPRSHHKSSDRRQSGNLACNHVSHPEVPDIKYPWVITHAW